MRIFLLNILILSFCSLSRGSGPIDSLESILQSPITDSHRIVLYHELSLEYLNTDYQKVIEYAQKEYELASETKNIKSSGDALRLLGSVYADLGNNEEALKNLEQSLDIFTSIGDTGAMARTLNNIGNIYWFTKDYEQAKSFYKQSETYAMLANNNRVAQGALMNIGLIFSEQHLFDSALFYMNNALDIARKNEYSYSIALTLLNKGELYFKQHHFQSALEIYNTVYTQYLEDLTPPLRMALHFSIARAYMAKKDFKNAQKYLDKAEKMPKKAIGLVVLKDYYSTRFQLDTLIKKYESAVFNLLQMNSINDSLQKNQFRHDLANFQIKYQTQEKEKENQLLRNSLELQHQINQKQKMMNLLIFSGLAITLVLIFIIFRQYKIKTASNKIITNQNSKLSLLNKKLNLANDTKNKFFSIVAHDIKNPFGTIMGFTELLHNNYEQMTEEKRKKYLETLYKSSKNTYDFLQNLLIWARTQTNSIQFDPGDVHLNNLINQSVQLYLTVAKKKQINLHFEHKSEIIYSGDENMLRTVINNLISNAIKFTPKNGDIRIDMLSKDNKLVIEIADNGTGMEPEQIKKLFSPDKSATTPGTQGETGTGLGLLLCDEFIKMHNGSITVESQINKGSTFRINLPLYYRPL